MFDTGLCKKGGGVNGLIYLTVLFTNVKTKIHTFKHGTIQKSDHT